MIDEENPAKRRKQDCNDEISKIEEFCDKLLQKFIQDAENEKLGGVHNAMGKIPAYNASLDDGADDKQYWGDVFQTF